MSRFTETTFTTASVPATDSIDHNQVVAASDLDIYKIKVVPSIVGVTSEVQIYERDTFLIGNLVYSSNPFAGSYFDPIMKDAAGVITEGARAFILPYEDLDVSTEIHIKFINNDSQAKTYDVTIIWDAFTG